MGSVSGDAPGDRLRELRKAAGLSLREVADHLTAAGVRVTHQAVSTWEQGKHPVPRVAIPALEHLLATGDGDLAALYGYRIGPSPDERMTAIEARQAEQAAALEEIRVELRAIAEAIAPPRERQPRPRR